jgi:hypothetical protein
MNNLYHWHDERMVDLEMKEINREIANANLLREAGLSGTDWLARALNGLLDLLGTRGREPQDRHSMERQSYPSRSE